MFQMIVNIKTHGFWTIDSNSTYCKKEDFVDGVYEKTFTAQEFTNARNYIVNMLYGIRNTYKTTVPYDDTIIKQEIDDILSDVAKLVLSWEKGSSYGISSQVCSISVAILKIS